MQQHNEEAPPDYFEIVRTATEAESAGNRNAEIRDAEAETELANNPDGIPAGVEAINRLHNLVQTTIAYLKDPSSFEGTRNASNSCKGFLDIMSKQEKLAFGFAKNIIYKLLLLIYYFTNFIYSIVAVSIQGEHFAYYLGYLFISLTGLIFEATVIVVDIRERKRLNSNIQATAQPQEAWTTDADVRRDYSQKAKRVFVDYVLLSLGELLIYPILICNLYGFINERAWRFNNGISAWNFLILLYSILMDMFTKFYVVLLVKRIAKATYAEYDKLFHPRKPLEWKRYFTPIYLTLPFTMTTALTHWSMTAIIGVRIYVDNFTPKRANPDDSTPNTGNYGVAPFTGYMIGFALCLPLFSSAVYVLLNKLWFYEVYSAIYQSTTTNSSRSMPQKLLWNMKLSAFIRDPLALLSVIFFMVLFIVFAVGTYLPDYNSSDYEVASAVGNAVQGLGPCFIVFFLLSNLQAAIVFTIIIVMIVTMLLCVLCVVCACLCSRNNEQNT